MMGKDTLSVLGKLRTVHWNFNGKFVPDETIKSIISYGMRASDISASSAGQVLPAGHGRLAGLLRQARRNRNGQAAC